MIPGHDETEFGEALKGYFTPAQPISKPEHLHGRDAKLKTIQRALTSPGKHVFIYGDRGIGKTSLAKTAFQIQCPNAPRIPIVACDNGASFAQLVGSICKQLAEVFWETSGNLNSPSPVPAFPVENSVRTVNDAMEAIRNAAPPSGGPFPIIVDEFDQLSSADDKKYFADLIKQLSDQELNVRFLICGIGQSLEELIGIHLSTDRYLAGVRLEQITHDARWQIIQSACDHFGLDFDRNSIIRIGQISDGFPYYVHLIGERIFWEVFDDANVVSTISIDHYARGIKAAIEEAQTSLRQAYELATQKHGGSDDYEEVLWAVADGSIMVRQTSEIYTNSYLRIVEERRRRDVPLTKDLFYQRMNNLKKESHGAILRGTQTGWYSYKESVVRGYARLRAEETGVHIGVDHIISSANG
jgi:Cdc6-like AAA superfamily ATPase